MMVSLHSFLSFSLLLLLSHGTSCIDIRQTCREIVDGDPHNVNFDFCVTSLQAVPDSCRVDLEGLGVITMNLTKSNGTDTIGYIRKLVKRKSKPYVRSCLLDCLDLYSDAISSLDEATNDIKIERYYEANIQLSATLDAPITCEDGFKERKGTKSPLSKRNASMFQLSAIALSIINMLSKYRA